MLTSIIASFVAFAATTLAQAPPYWSELSNPFNLIIQSYNKTFDGIYFGAAYESSDIKSFGLMAPDGNANTFYYNTPVHENSDSGLLTLKLIQG
jgi:hypothetical protein